MIYTPNFTYIHPMKCSGTFITNILLETTDAKKFSYHCPRSKMNFKHQFVTSVRNPFDWYVSLYYHCIKISSCIIKDKGNFKDTIMPLLELKSSELYSALLNTDWRSDPNRVHYKSSDFEDYPDDIGFYSWEWRRMVADKHGEVSDVHIVKTETVREDLINTFKQFGGISKKQELIIRNSPKANVESNRGDYHTYYDDETIEMVYDKDSYMFDRFGYSF